MGDAARRSAGRRGRGSTAARWSRTISAAAKSSAAWMLVDVQVTTGQPPSVQATVRWTWPATTRLTCGERAQQVGERGAVGRREADVVQPRRPMSIGGWCMATIVGVSGPRRGASASHSTSSAPSSRPPLEVSQATMPQRAGVDRVLQRLAEQVVVAGEPVDRHRQRCEQFVGERVLARVAGVRDVAGDEHGDGSGSRASTRSTARGELRAAEVVVVEAEVRGLQSCAMQGRGHGGHRSTVSSQRASRSSARPRGGRGRARRARRARRSRAHGSGSRGGRGRRARGRQ